VVLRLGAGALPALFTAVGGENSPVRREARVILARALTELGIAPAAPRGPRG
jgi:hypothetical protein